MAETGDPPEGGGGAGSVGGRTGAGAVDTRPLPTVMVLLLERVPILAVTVATPFLSPVTTPALETLAIVVSLEARVI